LLDALAVEVSTAVYIAVWLIKMVVWIVCHRLCEKQKFL